MRLFVAIDMPVALCDELSALQSGVPGARWLDSGQLHLTLRFVGDVDPPGFDELAHALAELEAPAFEMALKGVGHFPPRGKPRVLWAGVDAPPALLDLQARVERAVVRAGLPADERRYTPHVTLARFRRPGDAVLVSAYMSEHAAFGTAPFPVEAFHLYSSHLSRSGAIHTVECSYPLTGAPAGWVEPILAEPDA